MARGDDEETSSRSDGTGGSGDRLPGKRTAARRERLTLVELWKLIMGTYKVSLPYLLVFLAGILLATWVLTELVF